LLIFVHDFRRVDKHRPNALDKVDFHKDQAEQLQAMVTHTAPESRTFVCWRRTPFRLQVSGGDFPHIMVYGPPGAGKKTRVMGMLRETFGSGVEKVSSLDPLPALFRTALSFLFLSSQLRSEMREFKVIFLPNTTNTMLPCAANHQPRCCRLTCSLYRRRRGRTTKKWSL